MSFFYLIYIYNQPNVDDLTSSIHHILKLDDNQNQTYTYDVTHISPHIMSYHDMHYTHFNISQNYIPIHFIKIYLENVYFYNYYPYTSLTLT